MDIYVRRGRLSYPSADGTPLPSRVEVAVIGGGMTGVLTALTLRARGIDAVVFEAEEVGMGGTGDCLGAIGLGDGLPLGKIEAAHGTTAAVEYAYLVQAAADAYTALAAHYRLRAVVERCPAVLYTHRAEGDLESEASVARRLGVKVEVKRRTELPFPIQLSLVYPHQGILDPLMFLYGLARQVRLFAGVRVTEVTDNHCLTDEGDEIEADAVVYACRTPTQKMTEDTMPPLRFSHAHAMSLSGAPALSGIYTGYDRGGLRMLWRGKRLLVASNPTEHGQPHGLGERIRGYYPTARIEEVWSLWDASSPDGLPLIGEIAPQKYLAAGYAGRGLSYAMLAAEMLTSAICNDMHPLTPVLSPRRLVAQAAFHSIRNTGRYS